MAALKQSTAYTRMFLVVQTADHISGLTGAAGSPDNLVVNISKAGGAFAQAAGVVSEVSSGWYKIALTTGDTGTLGDLAYHITSTSGDPTDFVDQVTANILGDTLPANTTQLAGQTVTAGAGVTFPASVASPTNITAGTITTVTNLTNAPTAGDLTATMKTSVTTAATAATPTIAGYTGNTPQTGDAYARIGAAGAGLTALGDTRIAHLDADISSRMATFTLPTRFSSLAIDASGFVVSSITGQIGGTIINLDALAAHGDATWATATGFAVAGNAMTLTTAYDAAKTAAQASDIPTSDISAIKATTDGLVNTAGKLWVLDGSGNAVAPATQTQAIQDKTDQLTFTASNKVDANVHAVNDVTVNGIGTSGSPWGP